MLVVMSVSYFSLLLKPSFPFDTGRVIRADTHMVREGNHVFYREEREVFRVTHEHVREVVAHQTHHQAKESVRCDREAQAGAGAASAHIHEVGRAPQARSKRSLEVRRGSPAEGFSVRVKE